VKIKIYWLKFLAYLETLLAMLVYNFHKRIKGVSTVKNIKYKNNGNRYNKFDIHYKEEDKNSGKKSPIVMYFHGGGWTNYSKHIFTTLTRRLADMGLVVFNCNYSLSPKYKQEDVLSDAMDATKYAVSIAEKYGGDTNQIIFAGDSAGAHISTMMQVYANNNIKGFGKFKDKIKALILFYGVYDLNTSLSSQFPKIKAYVQASIHSRIGTEDAEEEMKKYSPMSYDISRFSPCFLASGAVDKLHKSQSLELSKQLTKNDVKHKSVFFDDKEYKAMHAFMIIDGISTNIKVLSELKKFLNGVVGE